MQHRFPNPPRPPLYARPVFVLLNNQAPVTSEQRSVPLVLPPGVDPQQHRADPVKTKIEYGAVPPTGVPASK